jgi:septal ring factor EnvC (AmiA/AmiB activator)
MTTTTRVVVTPARPDWKQIGQLQQRVADLEKELSAVKSDRRGARKSLTNLRGTVGEFADWIIDLKGRRRPYDEIREWAEYLKERAGRRR